MTALSILQEARLKILLPENWTQTYSARDQNGNQVPHTSSDAVCWCAIAAIWCVVSAGVGFPMLLQAVGALRAVIGGGSIIDYNDSHTHAEVLAVFDEAIRQLAAYGLLP